MVLKLINSDELLINHFQLVFFMLFFLSFFEVFSAISRSLLNATIPIFLREIFLKGVVIICSFLWIRALLPILLFGMVTLTNNKILAREEKVKTALKRRKIKERKKHLIPAR